jgi:cell division septum initiation protein DivIVA
MEPIAKNRFLLTVGFVAASILSASALLKPPNAVAQDLPTGPNQAKPINPSDPNVIRPEEQQNNLLSMSGGQRLIQDAQNAVKSQNYAVATKKLQEARQVFNQLSNFHQDLAGSFSGIDNRIADSQRKKALEAAQFRDEATYQLALVHRAQNQPELAVPLLVQIIRSQQPTRDLGQKAYQQLLELGFVDSPYPRPRAEQPSTKQ